MKYSSTHRLINTVIFGVLSAGFATLVVFFTFLWAPHTVESHYLSTVSFITTDKSFAFNANLGILFFALAAVSVVGLVFSIKSLLDEKNDQLVIDSYLCFVSLGYVVASFFVLNAIWLYSLIGGAEVGFWIVLCIIAAIGALIAANVPMMSLLQDDKSNRLSVIVHGAFAAIGTGAFITFIYSLIVVLGSSYSIGHLKTALVIDTIIAAVSCVCGVVGMLMWKKGKKLASLISNCGILSFAALPLASGIRELILADSLKSTAKFSLVTVNATFAGDKYCILAIITGSIIAIAAIALFITSALSDKKD